MKLMQWLKGEIQIFVTWEKPKAQKAETLLSSFLKDIAPALEKDLLGIVANGLPIVIATLGTNPIANLGIAETAAEDYLLPALKAEGITLFTTSENILKELLMARAQISLASSPTVVVNAGVAAPVIIPIPSLQANSAINTAGQ